MFYQLEKHGSGNAVIDDYDHVVSYEQLAQLADWWFGQLVKISAAGNSKKLVLIRCRNHLAPLVAYLGCLRHGHVPLLIADSTEMELLQSILSCYSPDFIYEPVSDILDISTDNRNETGAPSELFELVSFVNSSYQLRSFAFSLSGESSENSSSELKPELALLLSTSGSTGSPKLVRLSLKNVHSNASSIALYLELNTQERAITSLPMNYSYGLSVINSHLDVGATLLLTNETVVQARFWQFFHKYQATSIAGVPYTYKLLKMSRITRKPLPSLKTMTQAGGHMDSAMVHEFAEFCRRNGSRLIVMYGQTEATARMSYVPWDMLPKKEGSVGIAIPGGRFEIIDGEGRKINTPGVSGNLVYYGANVCLGIAHSRADLLAGDLNQGRLETGDRAYCDEDGYFFITGRSCRFIKLAGLRFGLQECEDILHRSGFDCIALGHDEHLCLALLTDSSTEDEVKAMIAALHDFIVDTFHLHHTMFELKAVPFSAVPRNESGKVSYQHLAREYFS